MNKTFEINKKNNESYSFSESLNTPIFPQIFKNFEIEKVKYEDDYIMNYYLKIKPK